MICLALNLAEPTQLAPARATFLYTASQVMLTPGVRLVISTVILDRTRTSPVTLSEFASKATLPFKLTDMKAVEHGSPFEALLPLIGETPDTLEPAEDDEDYDPKAVLKLAIVGRPNAGKSTLINRLLGENRLLTGPEAGITRDSISLQWKWEGDSGAR